MALRDGIASAGIDSSDIDLVFRTHRHVDHAGLALRLAEGAGTTFYARAGTLVDR